MLWYKVKKRNQTFIVQSKNTRDFSDVRFKYFNNHCVLYIWNDVFQNEQEAHKTNSGI